MHRKVINNIFTDCKSKLFNPTTTERGRVWKKRKKEEEKIKYVVGKISLLPPRLRPSPAIYDIYAKQIIMPVCSKKYLFYLIDFKYPKKVLNENKILHFLTNLILWHISRLGFVWKCLVGMMHKSNTRKATQSWKSIECLVLKGTKIPIEYHTVVRYSS